MTVNLVATPDQLLGRLVSGMADPYPDYHALRAQAPVHRFSNAWFLTRYADCSAVVHDTRLRVQDPAWYDLNRPSWRENVATRLMYQSVQSRNDPDHARLRRVIGGAFSARRMADYRALVERMAPRMFDRRADEGRDGGRLDLMDLLACPLPAAVIGELLGVPEAEREQFRSLGGDFFNVLELHHDAAAVQRARAAAADMLEYLTGVIAQHRRAPRRGLVTELIQACDAGLLAADEMLGLLLFLFPAGSRTTTALIGNATQELLENPAEANALRGDASRAAAVVEESLRHEAPSQIVPRQTVAAYTVGGVEIPAGELLICLTGAANRDPEQYHDPDRFLPGRPGGRALSFGGGLHYCMGAALSRMEATVVLPLLLRRFPRLALAGEPVRQRAMRGRLHASFPVTVS